MEDTPPSPNAMADFEPIIPDAPDAETGPDVMNDPAFNPPQRTNTNSTKAPSEAGSSSPDTCRICRSEGTPEEPLFYPCKCSGSIKFVHQECLMEWLSHSRKKHCELCKTPFKFTKLYDADMPQTLPWRVFVRRACMHVLMTGLQWLRGLFVAGVWLLFLPWLVRWGWRWTFWIADAGWARELFMHKMKGQFMRGMEQAGPRNETSPYATVVDNYFKGLVDKSNGTNKAPEGPLVYSWANEVVAALTGQTIDGPKNATSAVLDATPWHLADSSLFSEWSYISHMSDSPRFNRLVLDIFEGQVITCVVIAGFLLVFLIREWVVQQQPLANLAEANQQLHQAVDHLQEEHDHLHDRERQLQRQVQLLDEAQRQLQAWEEESGMTAAELRDVGEDATTDQDEFMDWQRLDYLMDEVTQRLHNQTDDGEYFRLGAAQVIRQSAPAKRAGVSSSEFADWIFARLRNMEEEDRRQWELVLMSEMRRLARSEALPQEVRSAVAEGASSEQQPEGQQEDSDSSHGRPNMPDRDTSFRATEVQRLLQEAEGVLGTPEEREARTRQFERAQRGLDAFTGLANAESIHATKRADRDPSTKGSEKPAPPEPLPITNAGPEARMNIKRVGTERARPVPEPYNASDVIVISHTKLGLPAGDDNSDGQDAWPDESIGSAQSNNEEGIDEPTETDENDLSEEELEELQEEIQQEEDTFSNRVASVFREEFGLDEAEELENLRQAGLGPGGEAAANDAPAESEPSFTPRPQEPPAVPHDDYAGRLFQWFWGDITLNNTGEPAPTAANEERLNAEGDQGQQAPFVPVQDGQPVQHANHQRPQAQQPNQPRQENAEADPEVLAAAQQAGIDAEAIEDAEDIEGILELIGMQGPLIALVQTSAFCTVLVCGTVPAAVGLPYMGGKLVLSIIGSPIDFAFKLPLQILGFAADLLVDTTLFVGGSLILAFSVTLAYVSQGLELVLPGLKLASLFGKLTDGAAISSNAAIGRLEKLFTTPGDGLGGSLGLGVNWIFLQASMHAHASLNNLEEETRWVFHTTGQTLYGFAETIATGSPSFAWMKIWGVMSYLSYTPIKLFSYLGGVWTPFWQSLRTTGSVTLTFRSAAAPPDPSLVWWSTHDRFLTIMVGYTALAMIATIYVALDTPITSSPSGQRTEKLVRDTLRQAGGVLKVILIISIEMLAFPLYCGILLDVALLPLFAGSSLASRLAFAASSPYSFCFVHWFAGTCYMFHFALFVGMCRKILRKGTIWFIRDPDDPTFHPVRDVLERGVATQLRKIGFSALVYGALVILCLGGVIWSIGRIFEGVFPVRWISTEPIIEFPMDLLLYNFCTPIVFRLYKPSDLVHAMYGWWLRKCARWLRLSHFLFDDRRQNEEGQSLSSGWRKFLGTSPDPDEARKDDFEREGKFVFTPCSDQYRPPKPNEVYLHYTPDDVYIADAAGKKHEHFAAVYIPPGFRKRIATFMVCLWLFSAAMGLSATLVPLCVGRGMLAAAFGREVQRGINDVHAFSLGAYTLFGLSMILARSKAGARAVKDKVSNLDLAPVKRSAMQALRCAYVYGFLGIIMPLIAVLILQFYLVLPLHTYAAANKASNSPSAGTCPASPLFTTPPPTNPTCPVTAANPINPVNHTIHLLQDYALGALQIRLAARLVFTAPASRWAEAFRRITAAGYANPSIRLFTRYVTLPTLLFASIILLLPPLIAKAGLTILPAMLPVALAGKLATEGFNTMVYRYCFPACAGLAGVFAGAQEVKRLTLRWRQSIRDEVYLVGERLHNFGEKKPPVGSRGIMRKV
ncbi:hypothetical protein MBLNU230_g3111t1 [Neophaeotheca triangularis]